MLPTEIRGHQIAPGRTCDFLISIVGFLWQVWPQERPNCLQPCNEGCFCMASPLGLGGLGGKEVVGWGPTIKAHSLSCWFGKAPSVQPFWQLKSAPCTGLTREVPAFLVSEKSANQAGFPTRHEVILHSGGRPDGEMSQRCLDPNPDPRELLPLRAQSCVFSRIRPLFLPGYLWNSVRRHTPSLA